MRVKLFWKHIWQKFQTPTVITLLVKNMIIIQQNIKSISSKLVLCKSSFFLWFTFVFHNLLFWKVLGNFNFDPPKSLMIFTCSPKQILKLKIKTNFQFDIVSKYTKSIIIYIQYTLRFAQILKIIKSLKVHS